MNCRILVFGFLATAVLIACTLGARPAAAQSLTTGDVTGIVTDPSGAVLPNAPVTLTNMQTGQTQTRNTNAAGSYRFSLLNPGNYTVSAAPQNFQPAKQSVAVSVGQVSTANLQLALASAGTTVEVTAQGGVIQTENGNVSTTLSPTQVANIPNPGNDLSYYVQTAPGAVMNTQSGYGNSATFGISGTSNLFTLDGMTEMDPFLNLNNSGATNLLLGANDVNEMTVVNNGYEGQYGSFAGANVNYVTKSGGNKFHGNAEWFWNGDVLNANDWFLNHTATPRPFDNANQWAASVGGPIRKNKTFFFIDTEGLRVVIPTAEPVNIPSPQFQAATLANLASGPNSASTAAEVPFYNRIFSLYNSAPGAGRAANVLPGGGCDTSITLAGGAPCALQFESNANNLTTEWILSGRVDQNIGNNDRAFVHFRTDHGLQASYTDPLTSTLNFQSSQPQYQGQLQENHTFGGNAVNQFIAAGSWYSAIFNNANPAASQSLMPYQLIFPGGPPFGSFYTPGGSFYGTLPQGRNVTQYQIEDDYSLQHGNHAFKFGVNFNRDDITDYTPGGFNATIPTASFASLGSFFNGTVDSFTEAYATRPTEPIALYSLGLYAQDEWAVRPNLKITLALRADHFSDPVCQTNCFADLSGAFLGISHDPTQPYNQAIRTGLHQALPNYSSIAWEPRFGFAYQPFGSGNKMVLRGGFGLFADQLPGSLATAFDTNSPLKNTFIASGQLLAPGIAGDAAAATAASNAAFVAGFNSGLSLSQIIATTPLFTPPGITTAANQVHYPLYEEWNLQVEQPIDSKTSLSLNYVGNHGYFEAAQNPGLNAYCNGACLSSLGSGAASFVGLPGAPLDPRFATVTEIGNPAVSNYNGLTVSVTRRYTSLQLQANYTWSHALDEISNGGFLPFNLHTNFSPLVGQDPNNLRLYNYGNSDYDIRHNFTLNYVYDTPKLHGWLGALTNWTVSGAFFAHTGLPFTVVDGALTGGLSAFNYGGALTDAGAFLFGNQVGPAPQSCGRAALSTPCLGPSQFVPPVGATVAGFGNQRRNQIYGPSYFDTDIALMKNIPIPHWEGANLQLGVQAFNVLNHPNFDQPIADVSNSQFGTIVNDVSTPTSMLGAFLGADASPRMLQAKITLQF